MDVFFIPFNGRYIIYRPLKRLAFIGNRALVDYLRARDGAPDARLVQSADIETFLKQIGYRDPADPPEADETALLPAMGVLLMTNPLQPCLYLLLCSSRQPAAHRHALANGSGGNRCRRGECANKR